MGKTTTAAIYCRISRDAEKSGLGVARQQRECEQYATQQGWSVLEIFVDNDVSAYSGKSRPEYRRMLEAVESGVVDVIVAYHSDRLHRSPRELEDFIDLIEKSKTRVVTTSGGTYDLATSDGRAMARVVGTFARKESEDKSRRLKAKSTELAEAGKWGGGAAPYGYRQAENGGLTIEIAEAKVIKDAAKRVLAGETIYSICGDLSRRGVPTAKGANWRSQTLRRILTTPTVAGFRVLRGDVAGQGLWKPILDEKTWRRLKNIIEDPSKAIGTRPARCYLLTGGVARCGLCGKPLHAQRRGDGKRSYYCSPSHDKGGCGKIMANADPVEANIIEALFLVVDERASSRLAVSSKRTATDDDRIASEIGDIEDRLRSIADDFGKRRISYSEWQSARQPLEYDLEALQGEQAKLARTSIITAFPRKGALRSQWDDMPLDRQRAVVSAVIESVVINPGIKRGPIFDPSRLSIVWRF